MPGLGEGFEQRTPQRRIGTVPPAIISMLQRLQDIDYDQTEERPMPNLKTFRASRMQDMRGRDIPRFSKLSRKYFDDELVGDHDIPRPIPGSRPYGHLVEMPGRRAYPGFETYGNETAMSPQFTDPTIHEPFVEGYSDPNEETVVAGPHRTSGTGLAVRPPTGSPQAVIDEMARQAPEAAARAAAGEIDYGGPTLDEYAARQKIHRRL